MEIFYKYLGGPRTFWGHGNSTTIINNNYFGGIPMRPFGRPFPRASFMTAPMIGCYHSCGGNLFNLMAGFSLASSLMQNIMPSASHQSYSQYNMQGMYNPNYANYNYFNNINAQIDELDARVKAYEQQVAELLEKQKNEAPQITPQVDVNSEEQTRPETKEEIQNQQQTNPKLEGNEPETPNVKPNEHTTETQHQQNDENTLQKNENKSLYRALKDAGIDKLDAQAQEYVKSRITDYYTDENGNAKYNITAIVHDGDTINDIIKRFYKDEETADVKTVKHKFHTQKSETTVLDNPYSGDTITISGVSEFGLKALMQDAVNGITRTGEITKTNKKMSDLKTAFINGEQKLSKAYVIQNHLMSESQYDKIISEKYS